MQAPERKIALPPAEPVSDAELKRRNEAFDRILKIRSEMKPLEVDSAEWIREDRERDELDDHEDNG